MVLHLPHAEGGFGVTFTDNTKEAAFFTTTSRFLVWLGAFSQERQNLWLPKDDLQDSASWARMQTANVSSEGEAKARIPDLRLHL